MAPLETLLEAERRGVEPTASDRERVRAAVVAKATAVGLAGALTAGSAATAKATASAAGGSVLPSVAGLAGWGSAVVAAATVVSLGWTLLPAHQSASKSRPSLPVATSSAGPAAPGTPPSAPAPSPRSARQQTSAVQTQVEDGPPVEASPAELDRTRPGAGRAGGSAAVRLGRLGPELARLRAASEALREGDAETVLRLSEGAALGSALAPEFAATRALALCLLDRVDEANALRARLLAQYPTSPLRARLLRPCVGPVDRSALGAPRE